MNHISQRIGVLFSGTLIAALAIQLLPITQAANEEMTMCQRQATPAFEESRFVAYESYYTTLVDMLRERRDHVIDASQIEDTAERKEAMKTMEKAFREQSVAARSALEKSLQTARHAYQASVLDCKKMQTPMSDEQKQQREQMEKEREAVKEQIEKNTDAVKKKMEQEKEELQQQREKEMEMQRQKEEMRKKEEEIKRSSSSMSVSSSSKSSSSEREVKKEIPTILCMDTDGGIAPEKFGSYRFGSATGNDVCVNANGQVMTNTDADVLGTGVIEYFCAMKEGRSMLSRELIRCEKGCSKGVCIR